MYNSFGIEIFDSVKDLPHDDLGLLFRHHIIFLFQNIIRESLSVDMLHNYVDIIIVVYALIKFNNIRMIHFKYNINFLV